MQGHRQRKLYMGAIWLEALATVIYCLASSGIVASTAIVTFGELLPPRLVSISLGNGLAYTAALYITARASKEGLGYLNPAITVAIMCSNPSTKRYSWYDSKMPAFKRGMYLLLAQFLGSLLGVFLVLWIVPDASKTKEALGVPALAYGTTSGSACALEAIGAFFLTFVALANECRNPMNARSASTSIAMGLAMTTLQLFAFPFSGACFNPFKAFWLFVVSLTFSWDWVPFLLGPFLGSLMAVLLYMLAFTNSDVLSRNQLTKQP